MKKTSVRLTALSLSVVLALGGAVHACAAGNDGAPEAVPAARLSVPGYAAAPAAYRDETVYVFADAGGAVENVIVSDWLKNPEGLAQLEDAAALTGVENVKGGEECIPNGSSRIWEAQGRDIYCQGSTDRDLPVDMTVSYSLNGQSVTPGQLAGKSGRVSIRFDYVNRQYETASIGGKAGQVYVPFAMVTAVLLDSDRFTNVSVVNGRLCNDGDRLAVVGVALPGLRENLALDEDISIPDYVELTADVTDFALETTFTVAVSTPFAGLDTEKWTDRDGPGESLDELEDAMRQLLDGSSQLYDGLGELLEKSGQLAGGVNQLSDGGAALSNGAGELKTGAAQLQEGSAALQEGLEQLTASSDTLNGGAALVFDSLLASASAQLAAAGAQVPALTAENYAQVLDGVIASLGESPAAKQIAGVKASLDSCNAFYQGLRQYTAGVAQAAEGAAQLTRGAGSLSGGAAALSDGAAQLNAGLQSLQKSVPALTDGVTRLHDGAGELAGGLEEFDEKGVQKILDVFDGGLDLLAERLEATAAAARNYRSFSGGTEAGGQVKFIYRTAAIEAA